MVVTFADTISECVEKPLPKSLSTKWGGTSKPNTPLYERSEMGRAGGGVHINAYFNTVSTIPPGWLIFRRCSVATIAKEIPKRQAVSQNPLKKLWLPILFLLPAAFFLLTFIAIPIVQAIL